MYYWSNKIDLCAEIRQDSVENNSFATAELNVTLPPQRVGKIQHELFRIEYHDSKIDYFRQITPPLHEWTLRNQFANNTMLIL